VCKAEKDDGSRKIQVLLRPEFGTLARNTVRRYRQEMGIAAIYPGPNLSRRHLDHQIYPYLLRGVTAAEPNHIWGIDITYIRMRQGWM
jgi:putative transposase